MEVSIEIKEIVTPTTKKKIEHRGWWGRPVDVIVAGEPIRSFDVYLTLIPTEEERAAVFKFGIHELWVEEVPVYPRDEIKQALDRLRNATPLNTTPERMVAFNEDYEMKLEAKRTVPISDYFNNPYIRQFENIREAHEYVDLLKKKILPTIKSNIDDYSGRAEKESFTL